jgi:hypothetical protein
MEAPATTLLPQAGARQTIILKINVAILVSKSDVRWRAIQPHVRLAAWFFFPGQTSADICWVIVP